MAKVRTPICLSFFTASRTSGVVPDSEAVSTTERSVMRLWPITDVYKRQMHAPA